MRTLPGGLLFFSRLFLKRRDLFLGNLNFASQYRTIDGEITIARGSPRDQVGRDSLASRSRVGGGVLFACFQRENAADDTTVGGCGCADKRRSGARRPGTFAIHSGNGARTLLLQQQQRRWWTCFLRADNKEDACPSDVNTKPRRRSRLTSRDER